MPPHEPLSPNTLNTHLRKIYRLIDHWLRHLDVSKMQEQLKYKELNIVLFQVL